MEYLEGFEFQGIPLSKEQLLDMANNLLRQTVLVEHPREFTQRSRIRPGKLSRLLMDKYDRLALGRIVQC